MAPQVVRAPLGDQLASVPYLTGGGTLKVENGLNQGRFAAATFTDETQRFAFIQDERDAIHGTNLPNSMPEQSLTSCEVLLQITNFEEGHHCLLTFADPWPV